MKHRELVALVTGASSGIGQACARTLAAAGHRVYGGSRTVSNGESFESLVVDVCNDQCVRLAVSEVLRRESRIDLLVNNAGVAVAGPAEETAIEDARHLMEVNFFGALRMCQAVLPAMRRQQRGLIVNISSLAGAFGLPFQGIYSASKFAIEGLTESLRQEVAGFGVDVILIQPGDIRTNITQNRLQARPSTNSPYYRNFQTALGIIEQEERGGVEPSGVARLVCRLAQGNPGRMRYTSGKISQCSTAWLKRWIPNTWFERIIASYYGQPRSMSKGQELKMLAGRNGA